MGGHGDAVPVLIAAAAEPWEAAALEVLARRGSGFAVHRRCVDLPDLMAAARTGAARLALASAQLPGLDADSVDLLGRAGVGMVAVVPEHADEAVRARVGRLGVRAVVGADLGDLCATLEAVADDTPPVADLGPVPEDARAARPDSRLLAVWGPAGAPGRTTLATAVAGELAHRGRAVLLVDADPYGGAVAQHLGILDGVSGLLAAVRSANAGRLDDGVLARSARSVGDDGLRVLTGLPRPDRWPEVRPAAFAELLEVATGLADDVVVDVGFSLEADASDPFGAGPQRNGMTLAALDRADLVLVVGASDPVGLARLARGLVDLRDAIPDASLHVVVNRSRSSLGWSEAEVRGMVEGFVGPAPVSFVPEDRATADRALMAGRTLVELGDSALRRAVATVVDTVAGAPLPGGRRSGRRSGRRRSLRRRRAGRAR